VNDQLTGDDDTIYIPIGLDVNHAPDPANEPPILRELARDPKEQDTNNRELHIAIHDYCKAYTDENTGLQWAELKLKELVAQAVNKALYDELFYWRARTLLTANDPLNIRTEIESRMNALTQERSTDE
jgi:hypothetical protein